METFLICFIFLSLTVPALILAAVLIIIALVLLFFITKRPGKNRSLNETHSEISVPGSLPGEKISPEVINITDTEAPRQQEPLVIREEDQKPEPAVSEWDEAECKIVFQEFILAWFKARGFEIQSKLDGDDVLIFKQENSADGEAVSIGVVGVWKPGFIKGRVEWARSFQMIRYRQYEKTGNLPLFVLLGMGSSPGAPASIYIVSLKQIRSNVLSEIQLRGCLFPVDADLVFETGIGFREKVSVK